MSHATRHAAHWRTLVCADAALGPTRLTQRWSVCAKKGRPVHCAAYSAGLHQAALDPCIAMQPPLPLARLPQPRFPAAAGNFSGRHLPLLGGRRPEMHPHTAWYNVTTQAPPKPRLCCKPMRAAGT